MKEPTEAAQEALPLSKAAQLLLEECRMVLPGIQALFGFQLIAVFNPRFAELLSPLEQKLHLVAIGLIAVAVALIMSPAAYHLQAGAQKVTRRFIRISTRLVLWSMPPLALSLCVEFYLVSRIILDSAIASILAVLLFATFFMLWFVFPRVDTLKWLQKSEKNQPIA
jgi:Family of unknown function (DUF6328)